jgi:hypothetical protein
MTHSDYDIEIVRASNASMRFSFVTKTPPLSLAAKAWRAGVYRMQHTRERRLLQGMIVIACAVPIIAGGTGMIAGTAMIDSDPDISLDSHFRFLSGLLFAIGLGFLSAVPGIERKTEQFRILTFLIFVGGMVRLASAIMVIVPPVPMQLAIVMEVIVTPILCLWQWRLARQVR